MGKHFFQVFGLGQCCLDYIVKVSTFPAPDSKCEFSDMVVQGGGPVATALVALTRWGIPCTFAGVLGDDPFGPVIKASLDDEGVDTSGVLVRKGFDSQFAFAVAEPGLGRRTIFWRRPTGPPPVPEELDVHLVPVIVDAGSFREGMVDLAPFSVYFLASAAFAQAFTGDDKPLDACFKLAELGPPVVGVTLGPEGYVALDRGRIIKRPAYPVEAVDTTGCGDIFHAGFIYGLLANWNVEKSLDFAAWAAAMASLKLGGRAGIPLLEDWDQTAIGRADKPKA